MSFKKYGRIANTKPKIRHVRIIKMMRIFRDVFLVYNYIDIFTANIYYAFRGEGAHLLVFVGAVLLSHAVHCTLVDHLSAHVIVA